MVDPFNDLHLVFPDFVTETTVFNKAFLVHHCMQAQPLAFVILWEGRVVLLQVLSPEVLVVLTFFPCILPTTFALPHGALGPVCFLLSS